MRNRNRNPVLAGGFAAPVAERPQLSFITNGRGSDRVAQAMMETFDPGLRRPFIADDGRSYVTETVVGPGGHPVMVPVLTTNGAMARNADGSPLMRPKLRNRPGTGLVGNANATLLRLEWTELDGVVVRAALPRLRSVADVRGRGLQFTIPNGMAKTVLQFQAQSSVTPATISMDGLADSAADRPIYNLQNLPLPIIHKDFSFPARQIATTRGGLMPLDLSMAELAARRVAEGAEQLLLGVSPSYTYAGGTVYGFTNFPSRITYALHSPLASSWIPRTLVEDILAMRYASQQHFHYGPWVMYTSLAWGQYLDNDLNAADANSSNITLRERLRQIAGIEDVVTLDYLNGYDIVLVQMTSDVVREVVGMDITTVQWETHGGMQLNFKVMCILTPNLRADFNGNTGIVHGTVAGQPFQPTGAVYLPTGNP
jgi:hypothetical protein